MFELDDHDSAAIHRYGQMVPESFAGMYYVENVNRIRVGFTDDLDRHAEAIHDVTRAAVRSFQGA